MLGPAWHSRDHISGTAVLEYGPAEINPRIGVQWKALRVSADPVAKPASHTRAESRGSRRSAVAAGERLTVCWREMDSNFRFRASGDTPHRPRGEAASHRSRLPLRRDPPSGRDLDDGTVSQLLEELAGEMNRPSDRKRRISGYGDRTWRRN